MALNLTLTNEALFTLVTTALGLQFAAFGWRIIREIQVGDEGRRTWFPVSDLFVVLSMFSVVAACIVLPIAGFQYPKTASSALATAYIVIAAHPLNTAAYYRLFSRYGRAKYIMQKRDLPYITDQEWVTLTFTLALVAGGFWLLW